MSEEGGCKEKCKRIMQCGHSCERICHIKDDCNKIKCQKPCKKINLNCSLKIHICKKLCYEKCERCEVLINKELPCGHVKNGCKCYVNINDIKCVEIVNKELPCGHVKNGCKCYVNINDIICEEIVNKKLPCGHVKNGCKCNANINEIICEEIVNKKLPCGHIKYECKCYINIKYIKCEEIVNKKLPCGHIKKGCRCYENIRFIKCEEKCERELECGHICQLKCYEDCSSKPCKIKTTFNFCDHINEIECYKFKDILQITCKEKCNTNFCNHPCEGTCEKCLEGSLHIKCYEKCGKKLFCGHICNQKCFEECFCTENSHKICAHINSTLKCGDKFYCKEKCNIGCKHGKCKKKCGELCERKPCDERCDIRMNCGHQCYGLCGELCPNICRICNPDEIYFKNIRVGELLYKTKCGHIFAINKLDKYFYNFKKNIEIYKCPQCNNILLDEPRYQNQIKIFFSDIEIIKKIIINRGKEINNNTSILSNDDLRTIIIKQYNNNKIRIFDLLPENRIMEKPETLYNTVNQKRIMPTIYHFSLNMPNKNNSLFKLLTLAEKFMAIEYYINDIVNRRDIKNEFKFIKNYITIQTYFKDYKIQINDDFYYNLKKKIDNMVYYLILKIRINNRNKNFLFDKRNMLKYTEEIYNNNFFLDLNLKDIYKDIEVDVETKETMELRKSFFSRWYKCKFESGKY